MLIEAVKINSIPAMVYGEKSDKVYLFAHGKNGYKEEAEPFAELVESSGWQVISIDLPGHGQRKDEGDRFLPWFIVPELQQVWDYMSRRWNNIALRANSIGAWYSMLAYNGKNIDHTLFVSPILDMEHLIKNMMVWAGVSEKQLEREQSIETSFGQTLSWRYLCYARENAIITWQCPTRILYGSCDSLTERSVVDEFAKNFDCDLMVMESGEHWFHTKEQLDVLNNWIIENPFL